MTQGVGERKSLAINREPDLGKKAVRVFGAVVDVIDWDEYLRWVSNKAEQRNGGSVVFCNAHVAVDSAMNDALGASVASADLCVADGFPVAWFMRHATGDAQARLSGPDAMLRVCELSARLKFPVFFYGSTNENLGKLRSALQELYPKLHVAGMLSPPFRPLTENEAKEMVGIINKSQARIVFVGLGCPKQEIWMAHHKDRIPAVLLGVGAAFDFHAGTLKRAPRWMQQNGLEWFFRLCSEPRRLTGRYFRTNARFLLWVLRHWRRRKETVLTSLNSDISE